MPPQDDPPVLKRAVAVGAPDAPSPNTLVIGGATVVLPIEMNPEEDPLHDDEVRLWSVRGSYDRTLYVSDAEVEPDHETRLMHYRFEDVPYGVYRAAVCVAGEWHDLTYGLVVTPDGVYLGGKKLSEEKPALEVAPPEPVDPDDEDVEPESVPENAVFFNHDSSMTTRR
jgi:hypothetical protein